MSEIDKIRLKVKKSYTLLSNKDLSIENFDPIKEIINTMNNGYLDIGKPEYVKDSNTYFSLSPKDKL